jgi:hypothetical protein
VKKQASEELKVFIAEQHKRGVPAILIHQGAPTHTPLVIKEIYHDCYIQLYITAAAVNETSVEMR